MPDCALQAAAMPDHTCRSSLPTTAQYQVTHLMLASVNSPITQHVPGHASPDGAAAVTVSSLSYTMTAVTAIQHKITQFFITVTWYRYLYSVSVQVRSIGIGSIGTNWYWSQPRF